MVDPVDIRGPTIIDAVFLSTPAVMKLLCLLLRDVIIVIVVATFDTLVSGWEGSGVGTYFVIAATYENKRVDACECDVGANIGNYQFW